MRCCIMKKTWKFNRVIGLFMSVFGIFQLCACGPSLIGEEIDESRTQIYFGLHQAGYGIAWFDTIKEGFEAKNPDIQLIPKPGTSAYEYNFKYNIGSMEEDIIFPGGGYDYASLVRENKILALDDVYQTEVAGKKLIDALMPNARNYLERNGHIYGMPVVADGYHMIFDADMWDDYGFWMNDEGKFELEVSGNFVKGVGQDGEPGTYDDGLPVTYSQFFTLLKFIKEASCVPFTWSGKFWSSYLQWFAESAISFMSKSDMEKIYSDGMDGEGIVLTTIDQDKIQDMPAHEYGKFSMSDYMDKTSQKTVRWENFEEIQTIPGVYYALCFAQDVMDTSNGKNFTNLSVQGSEAHTQAQEHFLRSVDQPNVTGGRVAMLIDGGWWENEAIATFMDMAEKIDEKYSAENRRFGIMPFPLPDDVESYQEERQDMGHFRAATAATLLIVNAKTKKADAVKRVLRYIYSEEGINIMRNYKLTMPLDLDIERDVSNVSYYQKQRMEAFSLNKIAVTDIVSPFGQYYESDIYQGLFFCDMQSNPFTGRFYNYYSEAKTALAGEIEAARRSLNMSAKLSNWSK